jgi:hypothetical protein
MTASSKRMGPLVFIFIAVAVFIDENGPPTYNKSYMLLD